jgi:hypothetical protein
MNTVLRLSSAPEQLIRYHQDISRSSTDLRPELNRRKELVADLSCEEDWTRHGEEVKRNLEKVSAVIRQAVAEGAAVSVDTGVFVAAPAEGSDAAVAVRSFLIDADLIAAISGAGATYELVVYVQR